MKTALNHVLMCALIATLAPQSWAQTVKVAFPPEKTPQELKVTLERCATLMKRGPVTEIFDGYAATNEQLHQCQYLEEQEVSACQPHSSCPAYASWSRRNPEFSPAMQRTAFISALLSRQKVVSAFRDSRIK